MLRIMIHVMLMFLKIYICGFAPVCDITKTVKVAKTSAIVVQYISDVLLKECEKGEDLYP